MQNIERLKMELGSVLPSDDELTIRLQEAGIPDATAAYDPQSNANKKQIYEATLSVLSSVANDVKLLRNYREEDQSISGFAQNIQNRIMQLENQIRKMSDYDSDDTDDTANANFFMLFRD